MPDLDQTKYDDFKQKLATEINAKVIEEAAGKVAEDIAPRSSVNYKIYVSEILIKRLINEAITRLGGK